MSRATSNFLESANAANAAAKSASSGGADQAMDDAAILATVESEDIGDLPSLADHLRVTPQIAAQIAQKLAKRGLIDMDGMALKLSRAGERAVRYTSKIEF
jgi:hypothetical protein